MKCTAPPSLPYTPAQMRALHRLAAQRGLSHADLRAAAGVASLRELDRDSMSRLIDRLAADRRDPYAYRHSRGRAPLRPGEVRLASDATARQRGLILHLLTRIAWPPTQQAHWLMARYRVDLAQLQTARIPRDVASKVITALDQIVRKQARPAAGPSAPDTEVPSSCPF